MITPRILTHEGDWLFGEPTGKGLALDGALTGAAVLMSRLLLPHVEPGWRSTAVSVAAGIMVMIFASLTLIELCRYIVDRRSLATVMTPTVEPSPDGSKLYRSGQAPRVGSGTARKELTR